MKLRTKAKGSGIGNDYCVVRSQVVYGYGVTAGGIARNYFTIEPLNGACNNALVSSIAGNYEFYRVKSAEVRFVPAGGDLMVGTVQVAIINSPEIMRAYTVAGSGDKDNILTLEQGSEIFPLAHGGTKRMDMGRQRSRQWYSVNYSIDSTINEYDRCVAGMFIVHHRYSPDGVVPGYFQWNIVYEFKGLARAVQYTLNTTLNSDEYAVPYGSEGDFPRGVILKKRNGDSQRYIEDEPPVPPKPA